MSEWSNLGFALAIFMTLLAVAAFIYGSEKFNIEFEKAVKKELDGWKKAAYVQERKKKGKGEVFKQRESRTANQPCQDYLFGCCCKLD